MIVVAGSRVIGPLEPYAAGFAAELERLGYTAFSVAGQLRLAAHLSRWLAGEGLDVDALTPLIAGRFLAARAAAGYTAHRSPKALSPLLGYLRRLGVAPLPTPVVAQGPVEMLLERYCRYLVGERGVGTATARGYAELVRPFVVSRATADAVDLAGLSSADVVGFVLTVSGERSPKTAQRTVSALRSLLRFCHVQGLTGLLDTAVPSVANRRVGLPRFLEPAQVAGLLASCDRTTVAGRRDFAMMTVMVRLGLRAGEVAALRLDDIDWRSGEITILGKGPRRDRLPLPADVGEAVAGYLRHGSPTRGHRPAGVRPGQGPAPGADLGRGDPSGDRRRDPGRAGPDQRAPAAAHRGHRHAARRSTAGPGRAGAAAPPRADHPDLRQGRPRRTARAGPALAGGAA